ncbi:MAG: hypothetical protein GY800_13760 [Planctomycetes bacterium]|nr:hypothetical protein [Planctomycetota bacterium]
MLDKNIPPLARASYIGCPWHGLLINGTLTDGLGGATIPAPTIPQLASAGTQSATQLIKVPGLPEPSRSTEQQALDTEKSYTWKNYALAMGDGTLHGQTLPDDWIIYIDPNKTPWLLTLQLSGTSATVRLDKIFGRISAETYPVIERDLASLPSGGWAEYPSNSALAFERNSTGSVILLHYYSQSSSTNITRPLRMGNKYALLDTIYKITISGTGSTDRETLGDGITATFVQYKTRSEMNTKVYESLSETHTSMYPQIAAYATSSVTVFDPDTDPQTCPFVETITSNYGCDPGLFEDVEVSRNGYTYSTLLRVVFDELDTETDILVTTHKTSGAYYGGGCSGSVGEEIKRSYDSGCQYVDGSKEFQTTGTLHSWTINLGAQGYGWANYILDMKLFRGGVEVDAISTAHHDHIITTYESVRTIDGPVLTEVSNEAHNEWVVGGVVWPHTAPVGLFVQMYSPQVFGVQAVAGDNAYCRLGKVATPNGSDSTHNGVDLPHDGLDCVGSHHPVDNTTVWAEPGTLDQVNAAVNFL